MLKSPGRNCSPWNAAQSRQRYAAGHVTVQHAAGGCETPQAREGVTGMSTVPLGCTPSALPDTSLQGLRPATIFYPNIYPGRSHRLTVGVKVPAYSKGSRHAARICVSVADRCDLHMRRDRRAPGWACWCVRPAVTQQPVTSEVVRACADANYLHEGFRALEVVWVGRVER